MQILAILSKMMLSHVNKRQKMLFFNCSSRFLIAFLFFPFFSDFLRHLWRIFLPTLGFDMLLNSTEVACLSLFLLAIISFPTTFSFLFDIVIVFSQICFFFIVILAFLLPTFDASLFPHFVHNVLCSACNSLTFLAHLSYSNDRPVFLSAKVYELWVALSSCRC